jgi:hypothetical protein
MEEAKDSEKTDPSRAALSDLDSRNKKKRERAKVELERLGADSIEEVLTLVRSEAEKRRKRKRNLKVCLTMYLTFVGVCIVVWLGNGVVTGSWSHFPKQLFNSFSSFGALSAMMAATQTQKAGTEWLAQFNDPRAIGPLLDALVLKDTKLQEVARAALKRLLPQANRDHASLLTVEHRGILRSQLRSKDREFRLAVLKSLPLLEDLDALPVVESLVHDLEKQGQPDETVLSAARETLSDLKDLQQLARERETLLRPSEAADGSHLLRPVTSKPEAEPEKLLRAVDSSSSLS